MEIEKNLGNNLMNKVFHYKLINFLLKYHNAKKKAFFLTNNTFVFIKRRDFNFYPKDRKIFYLFNEKCKKLFTIKFNFTINLLYWIFEDLLNKNKWASNTIFLETNYSIFHIKNFFILFIFFDLLFQSNFEILFVISIFFLFHSEAFICNSFTLYSQNKLSNCNYMSSNQTLNKKNNQYIFKNNRFKCFQMNLDVKLHSEKLFQKICFFHFRNLFLRNFLFRRLFDYSNLERLVAVKKYKEIHNRIMNYPIMETKSFFQKFNSLFELKIKKYKIFPFLQKIEFFNFMFDLFIKKKKTYGLIIFENSSNDRYFLDKNYFNLTNYWVYRYKNSKLLCLIKKDNFNYQKTLLYKCCNDMKLDIILGIIIKNNFKCTITLDIVENANLNIKILNYLDTLIIYNSKIFQFSRLIITEILEVIFIINHLYIINIFQNCKKIEDKKFYFYIFSLKNSSSSLKKFLFLFLNFCENKLII